MDRCSRRFCKLKRGSKKQTDIHRSLSLSAPSAPAARLLGHFDYQRSTDASKRFTVSGLVDLLLIGQYVKAQELGTMANGSQPLMTEVVHLGDLFPRALSPFIALYHQRGATDGTRYGCRLQYPFTLKEA
ncbi:hypothetical protein EGR_06556 [Echinococcus granulosus]|uniref:Uncharacterized protein n=1 Tax=Echinococcus granulosus TaxID=6210 RepID=W6UYD0_ECHGR|nr:hypothetical protein EGR_06556 [Echinococcus granulosus]EUB58569.1 hypothetical protein EGR_06556 [Echinococcus granulosus]